MHGGVCRLSNPPSRPGTNFSDLLAQVFLVALRRHTRSVRVRRVVVGLFALLSSVHQHLARRDGALPAMSRLGRDIRNALF
jgi:hypothetical protein